MTKVLDNGQARGFEALYELKVRHAPSIQATFDEVRLDEGESVICLIDRMVQADGFLWAPLADLSGRYVAYAKLNERGEIAEKYLETREETPMQNQLIDSIRRVSAMMRWRKERYHVLFFNSGEDAVSINVNSEVYNPDNRDAGMHMQIGLDLIDSMLPLFGTTALPPDDNQQTPYNELPVSSVPTLAPPMSPVIDMDMTKEVVLFASYLRYDADIRFHVRYGNNNWRDDRNALIEHPTILSAKNDLLLIASMLETLASHLGGARPVPPREQMPVTRDYEFYLQLAKRIFDQSKPAITSVYQQPPPPPQEFLSPQAATSEYMQQQAQPVITATGQVDWAALVTPIEEQVGKMLLKAFQDWLASRANLPNS